jgi:F-type H+-transporting ATPase subunit gamma
MPSLRDIRSRIGSVKNTRQITRAMKLVAGAKLARATGAATAAKPYKETLGRVLGRVVAAAGEVEHPLLTVPDNKDDVLVVLLTTDRGLCGGFNASICRATFERIEELKSKGKNVTLWCYGKKGRQFFQNRGIKAAESVEDLDPRQYGVLADSLGRKLVEGLLSNRYSAAYLSYNEYRSVIAQKPRFDQALPMKLGGEAGAATEDYIYEPDGATILGQLLPMALRTQLLQALLETQAGEQASRMTAMDNATRNASELINGLTLQYNRARQAYITKELIEIVSGAEAL